MQLKSIFAQLVKIFNWFEVVISTAGFQFELADSFSRSNWQRSNWQWIGRQLQLGDSITVNSDTNHLKFNSLKYLLACNWRYLGLESFTLSDLFTRTHTDVNSHVCEGYSGRCLFCFQRSTVNICDICTKGNIC